MFNYIKDAIINDVKKAMTFKDCSTHELHDAATEGDEMIIKRFGNYKLEGIKGIVRTNGTRGQAGKYTLDLAPAFTAATTAGIVHVELVVKMDGKYLGEYANANWAKFGKKFIVEVSGAANDDAINAAFKEAVKDTDAPFDCEQNILSVESASKKLTITLSDPYLSISKDGAFVGVLASQCPDDCGLLDFEEINAEVETTTPPVLPFATGEWLMENLRVPTYYNRRFGAVGESNYPVAGQLYDQIAFEYVMDRPGLGGLSAVGQKIQSATTHVLYIPSQNQANVAAAASVVVMPNDGTKKLTGVALTGTDITFTTA